MRESLGDIAKEIEATGKPKRMRVRRLLAIVGQERRGHPVGEYGAAGLHLDPRPR